MTVCGSHCLEANIFIKTVPLLTLAGTNGHKKLPGWFFYSKPWEIPWNKDVERNNTMYIIRQKCWPSQHIASLLPNWLLFFFCMAFFVQRCSLVSLSLDSCCTDSDDTHRKYAIRCKKISISNDSSIKHAVLLNSNYHILPFRRFTVFRHWRCKPICAIRLKGEIQA